MKVNDGRTNNTFLLLVLQAVKRPRRYQVVKLLTPVTPLTPLHVRRVK